MKTYFVCLANSKKYGERCIAGIEVTKNETTGYSIVRKDNKPKWIRPVTGQTHGQVPAELVKHIRLFDVVEIETVSDLPNGYQSENISFYASTLKVVSKLDMVLSNLEALADHDQKYLFGQKGKAIEMEDIEDIHTSLTLIKAEKVVVQARKEQDKVHFRMNFHYKSVEYDLPITDVNFIVYYLSAYEEGRFVPHLSGDVYLAISLGIEYEGLFYKLIAGVLWIKEGH